MPETVDAIVLGMGPGGVVTSPDRVAAKVRVPVYPHLGFRSTRARLITRNSIEVILPTASWAYASGQTSRPISTSRGWPRLPLVSVGKGTRGGHGR
jgi:hypothetical protein